MSRGAHNWLLGGAAENEASTTSDRAEPFGAINEGPRSAMRSLSAMSKDPAS
jgi:hypothetical protein